MTRLVPTPGQTVGPFYGYALPFEHDNHLVPPYSPGSVRLHGTVFDGNGDVVPDAILEIWQADADGRVAQEPGSLKRDGYTFTGWGRGAVDNVGHFSFTTLEPGATEPGAARFVTVVIFARGLLDRLFTRVYLPLEDQEAGALENDALLASLPEDERRTLIARRDGDGSLVWDVRLQGEGETVFLDYEDAGR